MRPVFVLLLAAIALTGCTGDESSFELTIRGVTLQVEIADTPELRERGLMGRRELPDGSGMLFVFDVPETRAFWMRETLIPLSIAYIDRQLVIREIHDMEPLDESPVFSQIEALYALEVAQGEFERKAIRVGDRLVFSSALKRKLGLR